MVLRAGKYTNDVSDLVITILKVYYQNDKYAKVKLRINHKKYGYEYEEKNYKLIKSQIESWRVHDAS